MHQFLQRFLKVRAFYFLNWMPCLFYQIGIAVIENLTDSCETQSPVIPESGDAHKVEINLGSRQIPLQMTKPPYSC
jgi:hypothetical protein